MSWFVFLAPFLIASIFKRSANTNRHCFKIVAFGVEVAYAASHGLGACCMHIICFLFPIDNLSSVSCILCILDKNLVRLSVGPGGRPRLWVQGRSFYAAHTMRSGIVRWRCTMGGCGCKAYTQKGTLHKLVGEHNHEGRCGRRRPAKLQTQPPCTSPPTPLLVPRLPNLDFNNFDPNAWVVPLPY